MARGTDLLRGDPVPGDPAAVQGLAALLRTRAAAADTEAAGLGDTTLGGWRGRAADAAAADLATLPRDLRRAADACGAVAAALEEFAATHAAARARVAVLRRQAEEAAERVRRARDEAERSAALLLVGPSGSAGVWPSGPSRPSGDGAARVDGLGPGWGWAESSPALAAAEADLLAARREADRVGGVVREAARAAARRVLAACEGAPRPPAGRPVAAPAGGGGPLDVVRDHAAGLRETADVLAVAGLAVTGVALAVALAPVAAATGAVAAAAGAVAVVATLAGVALSALSLAVNGSLVAAGEAGPPALVPDLIALGTLGASRLVTAPVRGLGRLAPHTVTGAAAEAAGRSAATAPRTAPSPFVVSEMSERELAARSVRYAVDAGAHGTSVVGGVAGARAVRQRERAADASGRTAAGRLAPPPPAWRPLGSAGSPVATGPAVLVPPPLPRPAAGPLPARAGRS